MKLKQMAREKWEAVGLLKRMIRGKKKHGSLWLPVVKVLVNQSIAPKSTNISNKGHA
jgi:hypothetical protein